MTKCRAAISPPTETNSTNATIAIAACKVDISYNQFGTPGFSLSLLTLFHRLHRFYKSICVWNKNQIPHYLRTRKLLKHLHHSFLNRLFDTLRVLDFVTGWAMLECVRSRATPQTVLTLRVRYLDDERSLRHWPALRTNCDTRRDGIQYRRPTRIRNVHFTLGPDECRQNELTVRFDFRHSLCRHLLVYRSYDYLMHDWIRPCQAFGPTVSLVLRQIRRRLGSYRHFLCICG